MPVTNAWGLVALLNGPGFYLAFWLRLPAVHAFGENFHETGRLLGVVVFWGCIGWMADWKLSSVSGPLIRRRWLRRSLFACGFALATLFVYGVRRRDTQRPHGVGAPK